MINLFLILFCLLPALGFSSDEIANLFYKKGDVIVVRKGEERSLLKGEALFEGDIIETGKSGLAIINFLNSSKLKLSSESSITLEKVMGSAKSKNGAYLSFYQKTGTSLIKFFNKSKKNDLEVRTQNVAIGVRGTTFLVGYGRGTEAGDVYTYVDEGKVTAMNFERNDHVDVPGGQGVFIDKEGKISEPAKLPWAKKLNLDVSGNNNREIGFYRKEIRQEREKLRPQLQQNLQRRSPRPFTDKPEFKKWNTFRNIKEAYNKVQKREGKSPEQIRNKRQGMRSGKMNRPGDNGPGEPSRLKVRQDRRSDFKRGDRRQLDRRGPNPQGTPPPGGMPGSGGNIPPPPPAGMPGPGGNMPPPPPGGPGPGGSNMPPPPTPP